MNDKQLALSWQFSSVFYDGYDWCKLIIHKKSMCTEDVFGNCYRAQYDRPSSKEKSVTQDNERGKGK